MFTKIPSIHNGFFFLPDEDAPEGIDTRHTRHIQNIRPNDSMASGYSESSINYGVQNNKMDNNSTLQSVMSISGENKVQPPPPSVVIGKALPPGHPCEKFTLPPPPADKKRTGPRRKFLLQTISA